MKVTLFMAMSGNGIIARKSGEEDFISDAGWYDFKQLSEKAGCFITGRKTYEMCNKHYTKYGLLDVKSERIIVSRSMEAPEGFEIADSPEAALEKARSMKLKSVILSGGSENNSSFMGKDLVDEVILNVEPVIVGTGIHVFAQGNFESKMRLIVIKRRKDYIQLHYKVIKGKK